MSKGRYYPKAGKPRPAGGGGGGGGQQGMMKQLQQMQQQMEQAQEALANEQVEYSAGGGMVTVVADGQQDILSITIDPQVIDPEDVGMLEDLVLVAVKGALEASRELAAEKMGPLAGGLDLGGMGLPGL